MPFNVRLEEYGGKVLGEICGVWGDFLPEYTDLSFPVLRLVDPYDETVFNNMQIKILLEEWERLRERAKEVGQLDHWKAVKKLAETGTKKPLRYLRFVGDQS